MQPGTGKEFLIFLLYSLSSDLLISLFSSFFTLKSESILNAYLMNSCYVHWYHSERIESYFCSGSCSHVELIIPLLSLLTSLYFPPWKENKTRKQGHLYSGLIEWLTLQVWNETSLSFDIHKAYNPPGLSPSAASFCTVLSLFTLF